MESKWISVEERKPREGAAVLTISQILYKNGFSVSYNIARYEGEEYWEEEQECIPIEPTHWQPLPNPPKQKEQL